NVPGGTLMIPEDTSNPAPLTGWTWAASPTTVASFSVQLDPVQTTGSAATVLGPWLTSSAPGRTPLRTSSVGLVSWAAWYDHTPARNGRMASAYCVDPPAGPNTDDPWNRS